MDLLFKLSIKWYFSGYSAFLQSKGFTEMADLILQVSRQEVFSYVGWKHILQKHSVQVLHGFNLLPLFFELVLPQEV